MGPGAGSGRYGLADDALQHQVLGTLRWTVALLDVSVPLAVRLHGRTSSR